MNVLHREETRVEGREGAYTNVWDYVSQLRAEKAAFEVAQVGNDNTWCRIIYSKMQNYLHKGGDAEAFRARRSPQRILTDFQGLQRSSGRLCAPNCAKNFEDCYKPVL